MCGQRKVQGEVGVNDVKREKVIKWFTYCRIEDQCSTDCPYCDSKLTSNECTQKLEKDVLSILEGDEPILSARRYDYDAKKTIWICRACGAELYPNDKRAKFCRNCGRKVKWNFLPHREKKIPRYDE